MNRCEQREKIIKTIRNTDNWDMLDKIEHILKEEPKYITDFIIEMFEENYGEGCLQDVYCSDEVMYAFELSVRQIMLKIQGKLKTTARYVDHWSDLYVEVKYENREYAEDLDVWISEQGFIFDSRELAWVVFNIWCGKVTFKK